MTLKTNSGVSLMSTSTTRIILKEETDGTTDFVHVAL
jgi:hypothetical protein